MEKDARGRNRQATAVGPSFPSILQAADKDNRLTKSADFTPINAMQRRASRRGSSVTFNIVSLDGDASPSKSEEDESSSDGEVYIDGSDVFRRRRLTEQLSGPVDLTGSVQAFSLVSDSVQWMAVAGAALGSDASSLPRPFDATLAVDTAWPCRRPHAMALPPGLNPSPPSPPRACAPSPPVHRHQEGPEQELCGGIRLSHRPRDVG